MSETKPLKLHACFEFKGNDPSCRRCSVPIKGSCKVMVNVINNLVHSNVKGNLKGVKPEDVKDIVSASINAIQHAGFKGETDGEFAAWVKRIVSNKRNDFFRRKYGEKEDLGLNEDNEDIISAITQKANEKKEKEKKETDIKIDTEVLLSALKNIDAEWSNFILEVADDLGKGLTHKEMAEKRNMIPNSFTRKFIRSKVELKKSQIIKEKFKDYL